MKRKRRFLEGKKENSTSDVCDALQNREDNACPLLTSAVFLIVLVSKDIE
jgi:hypothetical protein